MICRIFRQLLGKTRRAQEAKQIHDHCMDLARQEIAWSGRKVQAAEVLVKQFQKEVTQWPLY